MTRPSRREISMVLVGAALLAIGVMFGVRAWWSAGEAADQANWRLVQAQTAWVPGQLGASQSETDEPCSNSLKMAASNWTSTQPLSEDKLDQVHARLEREGWVTRSEDAAHLALTKEFEGRVAEIDLVKPAGVENGQGGGSLTLAAHFCGL